MNHAADSAKCFELAMVWYVVGMLVGSLLMSWLGPPWRGIPWRHALTAADFERLQGEAFRRGCEYQAQLDARFREQVGRAVARMDTGSPHLGYQLLQDAIGRKPSGAGGQAT